MANRRGPLLPLLLVVSVVADAVLVTNALDDLASGPSRAGFSLLAHAINLAIGAAAVICVPCDGDPGTGSAHDAAVATKPPPPAQEVDRGTMTTARWARGTW
jgi:hypothetical protein